MKIFKKNDCAKAPTKCALHAAQKRKNKKQTDNSEKISKKEKICSM